MKIANIPKYIDDAEKIAKVRPAHRVYLDKLLTEGKLAVAGPFPDGTGAIIVYEASDLTEAKALAEADPFCSEGVFASYELHEWKIVFSNPALVASGA